jgi:twinkle protein
MEREITSYFDQKGWEFKFQSGEYILKACPFCGDQKNHFYISASTGAFHCFKCEEKGNLFSLKKRLGDLPEQRYIPKPTKTIDLEKVELRHKALLENKEALNYLQVERGFSLETIKQFRLGCEGDWIAIPYLLGGELTKYRRFRGEGEKFRREPGLDSDLYVTPNPSGNGEVIITEGEFDAISLTQLGFSNVVSVSVGANSFKPEWIDFFEPFKKIYVCFDNDQKGNEGAEKLAQRLGRYRCHRVRLPQKDGNQCLVAGYTKDEIDRYFKEAEEYKPKNLKAPGDYKEQLVKLWKRDRMETVSTGWKSLDRLLGGLRRGELTTVTGETGQGKSTWVCNLAFNRMKEGELVWIGSFEAKPPPLLAKFASMHLERSFYRLSENDLQQALYFIINLPLRFLDHWGTLNVDTLKESLYYCKRKYDVKLAIIDHLHAFIRYTGDAERQAIDQAVTAIKAWAMELDIPIFLVVHPKNIQGGPRKNPIIEATDLKGSSGIRQWSDNVISIWRDKKREEEGENLVVVKLMKVRDDTGREGNCVLRFDPDSQRYFDDDL